MTEADAEYRLAGFQYLFDHRNGVFASCRRVARTIGQKHTIRIVPHDVIKAGTGRNDRDMTALTGQTAQDVSFGTEINGNHPVRRRFLRAETVRQVPAGL